MPTILEGRPEVTTSVIEVSGVAQQIGNRSPVTDLLRTPENDPCARRSHGSMRYKRGYPHLKGLGSAA